MHICHDSFQKDMAQNGYNAEELCLNLYYFFKRSSCRWKGLFESEKYVCLEELIVLWHVQSVWSSLIPALQLRCVLLVYNSSLPALCRSHKVDQSIHNKALYKSLKCSMFYVFNELLILLVIMYYYCTYYGNRCKYRTK